MTLYVMLPAQNIYQKQLRVAAHKHTPCSREELKRLQALVPRLRDLRIANIVCSDLEAQSAEAVARRLNVPVEEWESLRRFNWGKLHGAHKQDADEVRAVLQDETVPVKGGDSMLSFAKRVAASRARLAKLEGVVLVIADAEMLSGLVGPGHLMRYHVYEGELSGWEPDQTAALSKSA